MKSFNKQTSQNTRGQSALEGNFHKLDGVDEVDKGSSSGKTGLKLITLTDRAHDAQNELGEPDSDGVLHGQQTVVTALANLASEVLERMKESSEHDVSKRTVTPQELRESTMAFLQSVREIRKSINDSLVGFQKSQDFEEARTKFTKFLEEESASLFRKGLEETEKHRETLEKFREGPYPKDFSDKFRKYKEEYFYDLQQELAEMSERLGSDIETWGKRSEHEAIQELKNLRRYYRSSLRSAKELERMHWSSLRKYSDQALKAGDQIAEQLKSFE